MRRGYSDALTAVALALLGFQVSHATSTAETVLGNGLECRVQRVSACEAPRCVRHRDRPIECAVDDLHYDGKVRPECETIPYALGRGMAGVASATCDRISGAMGSTEIAVGIDPKIGVVAIKDGAGYTMGTGTLISTDMVVTAYHVFVASIPPRSATFGLTVDRFGKVTAQAKIHDFSLCNEPAVFDELLDYVVLRMSSANDGSCSKIDEKTLASPRKLGFTSLIPSLDRQPLRQGEALEILGYTDNVFFPRGLVKLRFGEVFRGSRNSGLHANEPANSPLLLARLKHNLQTAGGFSGAPIFDRDGRWVAIHQRALRFGLEDELGASDNGNSRTVQTKTKSDSLDRQQAYSFERLPNEGTFMSAIVRNILKRCQMNTWAAFLQTQKLVCD